MNVFATSIREAIANAHKEVMTEIEQAGDYKHQKIIGENVEKRTRNEKHYILEDGTQIATVYPSNVHYKENGKFVEIDNSLETKKDTKETLRMNKEEIESEAKSVAIMEEGLAERAEVEAKEKQKETQIYENKSNSYKTTFTNKTKEYKLGSMTSEGHTITWRLRNANSVEEPVIKNSEANKNVEGLTINDLEMNQVSSAIEYKNILNNVNIEYSVVPEQIKENIILDNKEAIENEIVFEYETNGLEMKLKDDKDIIVYKDKESNVKFTIKAPFMYDSKLEFSDKIEMKLVKEGKKYVLTLVPNKEWLENEERAYPVIIDPTIQTSLYVEDIDDTFIYKGDTNNTTRHNAHILRIGNGKFLSGNPLRSLIKFSLPTLKSGDQVIAAELSLRNYPETQEWNPPTEERTFCVHKVTASWTGSSANWSNISSKYDSKAADYIKYKYSTSDTRKDNRFDITSIVKDWYTNGKNYGVMIKEEKEANVTTGTDAYFYSANTSGTYINYRPKIIIAYRNQTGIEEYLSYHHQSVGRAGEVYTNDYNGNLTLIHTDAVTHGGRLPITIQHIYNTNEKDNDIGYGKGFRLNLSQTLELQNIGGTEYIKYIDEDATVHYFKKNSNTNLYEDEDGLGLTIANSSNDKIMTDKSGSVMKFVKYSSGNKWHLKEIKDTNSNIISLTLTTYNNQYLVSQVQDAAGDIITLTYSSGTLQGITDAQNRKNTYIYDSSNRLTTIGYPDNKYSTYTYGNKNELKEIENIDNSQLYYDYYTGNVYRIKTISQVGTDNAIGNSLNITYGNNLTKFVDNRGYANTYVFDNSGHCVSISDFGNEAENVNNAYGQTFRYNTNGNANNKLALESQFISVKELEDNLIENSNFDDGTNNWVVKNCNSNDKIINLNGNNVFKITGESKKKKYLDQTIDLSGEKGDIYTFYGWIKSLGVPNVSGGTIFAGVTIGLNRSDGTVQWIDEGATSGTDGWQFISTQFIATTDYVSILVRLKFYQNVNEAYFDNVGLFKEEHGTSYTYDSKGNIISTQELANQKSTFEYNNDNNLIKSINPKGGSFTYTYDQNVKGRLLNSVNSNGNKYSFDYDNYGNIIKTKLENSEKTSKYIENKATYTTDGNYLQTMENQLGENTTYSYSKGQLRSVTDPKGITINYGYDLVNKLLFSRVRYGDKMYQNLYTYENDKLKKIKHNGFEYDFSYDSYNNLESINVGNQNLLTNYYDSDNGNLIKTVYGNGQELNYTYDRFNRIIHESRNSGTVFDYTYDGRGNITSINNINGYPVTFKYDLSGRLVELNELGESFRDEYKYDENGNISNIDSNLPYGRYGYTQFTSYEYDLDNNVTETYIPSFYIQQNYDGLQRVNNKKLYRPGIEEKEYNINYTYNDVNENRTTIQIKSIKNNDDDALNYTYDKNGNIETISKGLELKQKYYYDGLDQLVRENNKEQNKTFTYEYDLGGNILNKKEYEYTEEEILPEATTVITYSYENENWKDQLTSYNNKRIEYDEIGNLVSYNGKDYVWGHGKDLASITETDTGKVTRYHYNYDGIRDQKIVDGTEVNYSLRGDKIVFERRGSIIYYYSYDEAGQPIGMSIYYVNSNYYDAYYYKKNLQGDIIGILDSDYNEVVKYTYDSWGKVLSITDTEGNEITDEFHIGLVNPFRYRGYYYDQETGFYYLKSRYYNPEWGRFLNADGVLNDTILGKNLYAYCENNPINYSDQDGKAATLLSVVTAVVGVVLVVTIVEQLAEAISNISFDFSIGSGKSKSEPVKNIGVLVASGSTSPGNKSNDSGYDKKLDKKVSNAKSNASSRPGGYNSFGQLKKAVGKAGQGNDWHHIVEQSQIKKSGFDVQMIQNKNNIISVSKGVHKDISRYYSSIQPMSNGMRVRDWLAGKSYDFQYKFGIDILKKFGGI